MVNRLLIVGILGCICFAIAFADEAVAKSRIAPLPGPPYDPCCPRPHPCGPIIMSKRAVRLVDAFCKVRHPNGCPPYPQFPPGVVSRKRRLVIADPAGGSAPAGRGFPRDCYDPCHPGPTPILSKRDVKGLVKCISNPPIASRR